MPDLSFVEPAAVSFVEPAAVPTEILDGEVADENGVEALRKCGRCRLSFVRHPSTDLDVSTKWWLCPQCRVRLLGDASKTNSRWA